MNRILLLLLLFFTVGFSEQLEKEHRLRYFNPIERYAEHVGVTGRFSLEDFVVRATMAQSIWGRHSLMVRQHFITRTYVRDYHDGYKDRDEVRMGLGMSLIKYFHTRKVSVYFEGGAHYTFGWFLGESGDPESQWLPDYSLGLAFPVSNSSMFKIGAQYLPLGFEDDWKLETGMIWAF